MAPIRISPRRLIIYSIATVSLLAFCYEFIHVSGVSVTTNSFRMKVPLVRKFLNPTNSTNTKKPPSPPVQTTTMNPLRVTKLNTIFQYMNMTRQNQSHSIFPAFQIGHYVMLNPHICTDAPVIDIIIIVHTAPENFEKRNRMRNTFANRKLYYPKQVRIAFLLGKPKNKKIEQELATEHVTYNDTIMGDFIDDYHNLTLKGVMGFRWVGEHCANSKIVLKVDDDVVVDVYKLLTRYMRHMDGKQKSIFCNTWRKNMMINREGKWKVANRFFPGLHQFPYFYCSGFIVLMTTDLMLPLHNAAKVTPFFWIDDVFLFGILPKVVGGVTYYDYQINRNITLDPRKASDCWKTKGQDCSVFATLVHNNQFVEQWHQIQSINNKAINWHVESVFEP